MNLKRSILTIVFCVVICVSACGQNVFASVTTINISTASELLSFAKQYNSKADFDNLTTVVIRADIDLSGESWIPIGTKENPFTLTVNGNGNTIKNISISTDDLNYAGFFGYAKDAEITDLNIENATINPTAFVDRLMYAGIITGYNDGSKIFNCSVSDSGISLVAKGNSRLYCGGIAGFNNGIITNTQFSGKKTFALGAAGKKSEYKPNIAALNTGTGNGDNYRANFADSYAGGIAGANRGVISGCTATSVCEAEAKYSSAAAGGIAGENAGALENCISYGKVVSHLNISKDKAYSYGGGICGSNLYKVSNCQSNAEVFSFGLICSIRPDVAIDGGGICGYNQALITDCTSTGKVMSKMCYEKNLGQVSYTGGCTGYNSGKIQRCSSSGSIVGYSGYSGGISGKNKNGIIELSSYVPSGNNLIATDMDIRYDGKSYTESYTRFIAGLVAVNEGGVLRKCFVKSSINASPDRAGHYFTAGGLACKNTGSITDCGFVGSITGNAAAVLVNDNNGYLLRCYGAATLGSEPYGGMSSSLTCGSNSGSIVSCYADAALFNADSSSDPFAATSEQMKNIATYDGWNFNSVWNISDAENNGYPTLRSDACDNPSYEGDGTADNPYRISSEQELFQIALEPDKCFVLTNDITLKNSWQPIGSLAQPFTGTLDGNGFAIKDLNISLPHNYMGFFGVTDNAVIKNLSLEYNFAFNSVLNKVSGVSYFGGAAAYAKNTVIENVQVNGNIDIKNINIVCGLVAGYLSGEITACEVGGTILLSNNLNNVNVKCGGIVGILEGNMYNCKSSCESEFQTSALPKDAPIAYFGGLCGQINGSICNSAFIANTPVANGIFGGILTADIAAVSNGNIKNTYFLGNAFCISYNGVLADSGNDTSLNSNMEKAVFPWTQTIDISRVSVNSKASKALNLQQITLDYNGNGEVYYEINGTKKPYISSFTAKTKDAINFFATIDGTEYKLNSYFVTATDESDMIITASDESNLNNSVFNNIASVTSISFSINSKIAADNTKIYIVAYDSNGNIQNVNISDVNLKEGNNDLILDNQEFNSSVTKLRIFAWDNSLTPYAIDKSLEKQN